MCIKNSIQILPLTQVYINKAAQIAATATEAWGEAQLSETLASPTGAIFGAFIAEELVGTAIFQKVLDEASLVGITILPDKRAIGIGSLLLSQSVKRLSQNGIKHFFLEVRSKNFAAIKLYEKCGFVQTGIRKGFYKSPNDDAILMTLNF